MQSKDKIIDLRLDEIDANEYQPRKSFSSEALVELEESIKKNGLIQPIIVRKVGERYQLVAGERRFRAVKNLGLGVISSIVKECTDQNSLEIAIIENVQRENLNPLEEADSYKRLIDEFKYTHEDVAGIVGKSRSYITNHVRILSLPERIKEYLKENKISLGHAKLLVNIENNDHIADEVVRLSLNIRQTENLIKNILHEKVSATPAKKSSELLMLEKKVSERLGMRVIITDSDKKNGSVKIMFENLVELQNILERLS